MLLIALNAFKEPLSLGFLGNIQKNLDHAVPVLIQVFFPVAELTVTFFIKVF